MVNIELSDGRMVQFKEHTQVFVCQCMGLACQWESCQANAHIVEPGDWIGLDEELVRVARVTQVPSKFRFDNPFPRGVLL